MRPDAEFDIIVYGATGYTGRLAADYLAQRYGVGGTVNWAMAGRSLDKLIRVRDEMQAPAETPLVVADADDAASLAAMTRRGKAVITTVGPYQLYGDKLIEACAAAGTDYLDLSGEPLWMHHTVRELDETARASGARILHSCGFDSIPFELGVFFCQETAKARFGRYMPRVNGRLLAMAGGISGGTAASGAVAMAALKRDPELMKVMLDPFALTPGFVGPPQPKSNRTEHDPLIGADIGPFMMALINTKNVHRCNALLGHPWGSDFVYDEMAVTGADGLGLASAGAAPRPGEGPSKAEREAGFYEIAFIGVEDAAAKVRVTVRGDRDPGYGSTSKILPETAVCLITEGAEIPGGVWTPGAAMGMRLVDRLSENAGLTFTMDA